MPENNKNPDKKIQIRTFYWEAVLFSLTLFLGIATAIKINKILEVQEISIAPINPWQFLLSFLVGTLLILAISFLMKSKTRKGKIFKVLFIFVIFWGGLITLDAWLAESLFLIGDIISLVLMIYFIFLWLKTPSVLIHNICIILGIAGVGATLGLRIKPETMVILLIIFSIYDFIAVYKTKHMVKMAKEMIEHQAILALVIPQKMSDFKGRLKGIKTEGKFLILGGGDIVFPLLLCVSLVRQGILPSLIVAVFSIIGLFFSYLIFINQKVRKPIPALPPIVLFSVLGFLITLLL